MPVIEQPHLTIGAAVAALARCGVRTCALVAKRRLHQPTHHVGRQLHFADGTSSAVLPGLRRDEVLENPHLAEEVAPDEPAPGGGS
jgi:hypothetical protein